jgi:poly(A) polymerase
MSITIHANAPWLQSDALKAVVAALDGNARIVGGAVRDSLLNLDVSDIDLATPLLPNDVIRRLEHAGIKAIPTGIDHGTVTAVSAGEIYEITTLRRDVSTDGRRATVAFSDDWKEDAARRDFTMNALYADPHTGIVSDYFGGIDDLNDRKVRFIGDAGTRIAEDYLRILRFFRFHARFGLGEPDEQALCACAAAANSLKSLSRERIADEIMKLLALPDPLASVQLMKDHGILAAFMPEAGDGPILTLRRLIAREQQSKLPPSAARRLLALLPRDAQVVDAVAARLKLSNKMRVALVARSQDIHPDFDTAHALAYRYGVDATIDLLLLHGRNTSEWEKAIKALQCWQVPAFPIKGGDLVKRGLSAGPLVAKTLQAVERQWVAETFPGEIRANEIADQLVADALSNKN